MNTLPELNDDLSDFIGDAPAVNMPRRLPTDTQLTRIRETQSEFVEKCPSCVNGVFMSWNGRPVGRCFKCKGTGKLTYKSSPEARAANRESAAAARLRKSKRNWEAFIESNAAEALWIERKTPSFEFAYNMRLAVEKYGELTERQMATVQRLMVLDAEREAARASAAAAPRRDIDVTRIVAAFEAAKASGLKRIKMEIAGVEFSRAPDTGRNPGAVYVKIDGTYVGKILEGKFAPAAAFAQSENGFERMQAVAADPSAAAKAHGIKTGNCSCCGRLLTDPVSIANGIGPICADRFGF